MVMSVVRIGISDGYFGWVARCRQEITAWIISKEYYGKTVVEQQVRSKMRGFGANRNTSVGVVICV